jgi:hypothetical protein
LEEGFNRAVAEAYRDGMKRLWREVRPVRPLRKPGGVITKKSPSILAFAGIGIEASEDTDWTLRLSEKEAAIATRHACRAEEGYPDWINALTMSWPKPVLPIIGEQIELEWASPSESLISFLHRYGAPAYSIQQPVQALIIAAIPNAEAKAISVLHTALRIIRNLNLHATQRTQLFKTANARFHSHMKTAKNDFALAYLASLFLLDPDGTLPILQQWLNTPSSKADRQARAEKTLGMLFDQHDPLTARALAATSTRGLEALLHLAYSHIQPKDDVVHHGMYSPGPRDNAEAARNVVLSVLLERPGADAYDALCAGSRMIRFSPCVRVVFTSSLVARPSGTPSFPRGPRRKY